MASRSLSASARRPPPSVSTDKAKTDRGQTASRKSRLHAHSKAFEEESAKKSTSTRIEAQKLALIEDANRSVHPVAAGGECEPVLCVTHDVLLCGRKTEGKDVMQRNWGEWRRQEDEVQQWQREQQQLWSEQQERRKQLEMQRQVVQDDHHQTMKMAQQHEVQQTPIHSHPIQPYHIVPKSTPPRSQA